MNFLKSVLAVGALMSVSTAALAQLTPPSSNPGIGPSPGSAAPTLWVAVWSNTQSLVQNLGVPVSDLTSANLNAPGTVDFGTLGGSSSLFSDPTARYVVFAADNAGLKQLFVTFDPANPTASGGAAYDFEQNSSLANAISQVNIFQNNNWNNATNGGGVNPYIRTNTQAGYWGVQAFSGDFGASLAEPGQGAVGTSLDFWRIGGVTGNSQQATTNTLYAGQWLLTATGGLTYTVPGGSEVPLPAAAWLLISGLMGLGSVARRKRAA